MKRGLVLSGGAAWGFANIGILDVLVHEKITFDCVAGSSMGAIVAAAYALGFSPKEIADVAEKISVFGIAKFSENPLKNGLHGGVLRQDLEKILSPLFGDAKIGETKIPFVCVAGKVKEPVRWHKIIAGGFTDHFRECIEPHVFGPDIRIIDALLASSAIPVVFSPVTIGDDEFVDMVHFGAIPARTLRSIHHPDIVIGTDTNPRYGMLLNFLPPAWKEFIETGHKEIAADRDACDFVLQPVLPASMMRFDRAKDFIAAGRTTAQEAIPELRKILKS